MSNKDNNVVVEGKKKKFVFFMHRGRNMNKESCSLDLNQDHEESTRSYLHK